MIKSNELTIEQMNEAIARFMGGAPISQKYWNIPDHGHILHGDEYDSQMKYHTSWDLLLPCWKKAGRILYEIRGNLSAVEYIEAHKITKAFLNGCQQADIQKVHDAVYNAVQFIQWYNNQNTNNANKL